MKRCTYTLLFALGPCLNLACGDSGPGGGGGESTAALCQKACTMAAGLSCPNDSPSTCASECEVIDQFPEACQGLAKIALECATARPASDWECDADGEAAVKDGICDEEGSAASACLSDNDEDGTCPFENDAECDDPTGTDLCPAGTDLADCGG